MLLAFFWEILCLAIISLIGRLASRSALMRARRAVERARGMVDEVGGGCYEKDFLDRRMAGHWSLEEWNGVCECLDDIVGTRFLV